MNNFFTELKNNARVTKLEPSEKQAMRVRLYNYLEQNPMVPFAAPTPVARPVPSTFYFFSTRYMVPLAFILIIGLGSGTAFAAQGALPGDTLYPVKINVNEAVQTALATSPTAKAEVQAQLATTRLEEAETLASTGKLDAPTTAVLASNFTAHAKAAQAATQTIESNDPATAAQLGADFTSTLAAHGAILAQIGSDSKSDATMQNSNTLALAVQQEAGDDHQGGDTDTTDTGTSVVAIADSGSTQATSAAAPATNGAQSNTQGNTRVRTFTAAMPVASGTATSAPTAKTKGKAVPILAQMVNPNDARISASLGTQASSSIAAMVKDYAAIKPALDADTAAQLDAQVAAAQTAYAQGNFGAAIRAAIKLDIFFKAGKNINIKLLSGLLTVTDASAKGSSGTVNSVSNTNINTTSTETTSGGNDSGKMLNTTIQQSTTDNSGDGPSVSNSSNLNVGNSVNIETHN